MTSPAAPRPGVLVDNLVPGLAIGLAAFCVLVSLELFGNRMEARSLDARSRGDEVAQSWGGPIAQPQPQVLWRRADAATAALERGALAKTEATIGLDVSYRRKGLAEYPGYAADVDAVWSFVNPSEHAIVAAFEVPLPARREVAVLSGLSLTVDGREDARATEWKEDRVVWTGRIEGGQRVQFGLSYEARGLAQIGWKLGAPPTLAAIARPAWEQGEEAQPSRPLEPVQNFTLAMTVRGARGVLDFPAGSMTPTQVDLEADGTTRLVWRADRLLTALDVGVVLPDKADVAANLARLTSVAPGFFLLYAAALLVALASVNRYARALHVLGLSAAFAIFFPLAAYLTAYLPWPQAVALAFLAIAGLSIAHAWQAAGRTGALGVAGAQGFFVAVPAAAYLVPEHTGLLLALFAVLGLGVGLRWLGGAAAKVAREAEAAAAREALPVAFAVAKETP